MTHVAAPTAPDSVRDDPRAHGLGVRPGRRGRSSRGPPAHGRCRHWPRRPPPGGWRASSRWLAWLLAAGPSPARSEWPAPCVGSRRLPVRWPRAWRSSGGWRELPQDRPTLGARLARVRPLAGEASGTSTVLGRASCVRSLAGVAAGWSRVSGFMLLTGGTPASRTLRVRREARTLRPAFEDRRHTVRREARVLVPAAEDRTIHPRIEDRSIDA